MKYIYGLLLFTWLVIVEVIKPNTDILGIAFLLGALCLFIVNVRFIDRVGFSVIFAVCMLVLSFYYNDYVILLGIPLFDCIYKKQYQLALPLLTLALVLIFQFNDYNYVFHIAVGIIFGYIIGVKDDKERRILIILDDERRLRYDLEQIKNDLVNSKREIEHLTEIRERNRIAHEIHDNIGHGIAGVLFQLQGAATLFDKEKIKGSGSGNEGRSENVSRSGSGNGSGNGNRNGSENGNESGNGNEKIKSIIALCTQKLIETLEMTRNTVYNIKADKSVGLDYIKKIIDNFTYCEVVFEHSGDFSKISASNMEILESNIREALTNSTKYSSATNININIDIHRKNIRLYYKDNGNGCANIKESVGLSGMRARVADVGGTISIDGNDGFLIVVTVPNDHDHLDV